MNHTFSPDLVGRLAIRLGRAFRHKWALDIQRDTIWNWSTAEQALASARSPKAPHVDDEGTIVYDTGSTRWVLSTEYVAVECNDKKEGPRCRIDARIDETFGPVLEVWLASLADFEERELWRFDRCLTSLSEGPWKPLHRLTPLAVIVQALPEYLPTGPSTLVYVDERIISNAIDLNRAMARAGLRFFTQWERMVTR